MGPKDTLDGRSGTTEETAADLFGSLSSHVEREVGA